MSNKRVSIECKGLFLLDESGVYKEIIALKFLPYEEVEQSIVIEENPIVVEDCAPKSYPGDGIRIYEDDLPGSLFEFSECLILEKQRNTTIFLYRGNKYIVLNQSLYKILGKED